MESQSPFNKNLLWSSIAHGLILIIIALFLKFSKPEPIKETPTWIDLASFPSTEPPTGGSLTPIPPEQTPPKNIPPDPPTTSENIHPPEDPIPEPPSEPPQDPKPPKQDPIIEKPVEKPEPKKTPVKKPISKPPDKPKPSNPVKATPKTDKSPSQIKVNRTEVVRRSSNQTSPQNQPQTNDFNPSLFSKRLSDKLSAGLITAKGVSSGGDSTGTPNDFSLYFSHVFQVMYGAWNPPPELSNGLTTKVLIRVEKDGAISKVSLAQSSGNKPMDDSALAAAKSVKKLNPLPHGLGNEFAEITVHFKIQHS